MHLDIESSDALKQRGRGFISISMCADWDTSHFFILINPHCLCTGECWGPQPLQLTSPIQQLMLCSEDTATLCVCVCGRGREIEFGINTEMSSKLFSTFLSPIKVKKLGRRKRGVHSCACSHCYKRFPGVLHATKSGLLINFLSRPADCNWGHLQNTSQTQFCEMWSDGSNRVWKWNNWFDCRVWSEIFAIKNGSLL